MTDIFMNVYVGQTRARKWIERLEAFGWGEMCCRGELPPRRHPWAFDNGAFKDWRAGRAFDEAAFERDMHLVALQVKTAPAFIVVPDIVAGGLASLDFSMRWLERMRSMVQREIPKYLAVQDGMQLADVAPLLSRFDGLFVGGTMPWKLGMARKWIALARPLERPVHIGRVGTARRVRWATRIGASSIDSCLPLWSEENLRAFIGGLRPEMNLELPLLEAD